MILAQDAVDLGIIVRDVDACLHFYCDILGLPKVEELPFSGNRVQHRVLLGGALLKLVEHKDGAPPPGPDDRLAQSGYRWMTIRVREIEALWAHLEANGVTLVSPPCSSRPGVFNAFIRDPDGNYIELQEVKEQ